MKLAGEIMPFIVFLAVGALLFFAMLLSLRVNPQPEPSVESKSEPERVRIIERREPNGSTTTISEPAQRCMFDCEVCAALERKEGGEEAK